METGPIKVTDSGSITPNGYALKGVTGTANNAGLFGYGNVSSSAINIDGVVGYVQTQQSVGVVGWAQSTGTSAYGIYGYSATGPGVYGFNANGGAPSVYGFNSSSGGAGVEGSSDSGFGMYALSGSSVGLTGATFATSLQWAGVAGYDESSGGANVGTLGVSPNSGGIGVWGSGSNGAIGVYGTSDSNFGLYATSNTFTALEGISSTGWGGYVETGTGGLALQANNDQPSGGVANLGVSTGEGVVALGYSGNSTDPALTAYDADGGTDLFGTYGFNNGNGANETFIVQSGTANASGLAASNGSDVQISGDLYVYGLVYYDCNSFPASAGGCSTASVIRNTSAGARVHTYSASQSLPTMEDFGEGRLVNGQAAISLEHTFASTIDQRRSYLVFITPEGDCHGIYVASKSPNGFVVRELMGGRSDIAFQYRIVAHPYGDTASRLAPDTSSPKSRIPGARNGVVAMHLSKKGQGANHLAALRVQRAHAGSAVLKAPARPAQYPQPRLNVSR